MDPLPAEARGSKVTVWYEEAKDEGTTVDVPYVGVVISVGARDGMSVRFDEASR